MPHRAIRIALVVLTKHNQLQVYRLRGKPYVRNVKEISRRMFPTELLGEEGTLIIMWPGLQSWFLGDKLNCHMHVHVLLPELENMTKKWECDQLRTQKLALSRAEVQCFKVACTAEMFTVYMAAPQPQEYAKFI